MRRPANFAAVHRARGHRDASLGARRTQRYRHTVPGARNTCRVIALLWLTAPIV